MSKIPFDIKFRPQIESGEFKVETRDGRTARIICWDSKAKDARFDTRQIIALVTTPTPGLESLIQCGENGILYKDAKDRRDLFLVTPEPELSEWQRFISACLQKYGLLDCGAADRIAKESAAELLAIARKQLQPEIDAEIEKAYKTADEVMYRKGKEDGIVEARNDITARIIALKQAKDRAEEVLKDLPRWKTIKKDDNAIVRIPHVSTNMLGERMLYIGENAISISCLTKLPGFKEDEE